MANDRHDLLAVAGLLALHDPDRRIAAHVAAAGPQATWDAVRSGAVPEPLAPVLGDLPSGAELAERARRHLAAAAHVGARLVSPCDDEWPTAAFDGLDIPPIGLYVRGANLTGLPEWGLAVVGARAATSGGVTLAGEIARAAADAGLHVLAGAAFGIDRAAHQGALAAPGKPCPTIAVLPCGIDRATPAAHAGLLDEIARRGAVISEYAPGVEPSHQRFGDRNRITAALAAVTVLVEAGPKSGATGTVNHAIALGRTVLAVPGPDDAVMSAGCRAFLDRGTARVVTSPADVLTEFHNLAGLQ